ncbi:hypothetical protein GCM10010260_84340 [Streptomyces filipinensis]|uniref:Uncharacterized protein n=1 Tax=Streptomyces filipinensis TaxID=66887 RepID=A0A918IKG9_9ACTN|nr:hypothetical protein [Streptomyces filipinensis]GGV31382.1 hypothetical protein GCM10010260_84340 [Streptomyces filipinensis]
MEAEDSEHMKVVHRWLTGEVVNNTVGIKLTGGPFNGRTKIVQLNQDGLPPSRLRARGGQGQGPWNPAARHIYTPVRAPGAPAGWTYEYTGVDTSTDG